MILRSAVISCSNPMASRRPRVWSSSETPSSKVAFLISRFSRAFTISERGPLRSIKLRITSTWILASCRSSRATLVCSGVTFSAWSMILLMAEVLSSRFRASSRPARILRLEMRARTGVPRSKTRKVSSRVAITSAS